MGFEVGGEEVFGLVVVLVFEGFVRGDEFGGDGSLRGAGGDACGEEEGCDGASQVHGLAAPSLPHGVAAEEASEDGDGGQQGDPEEVWVALVVGGGEVTRKVADVELLGAEGCGERLGGKGCEVTEVIDGGAKVVVTVAEGVGGVGVGVEAEGALAHLELDGSKGERGLRCVGYGDADGGGVVEIGGDDGGEGEVGGVDGRGRGGSVGGTGDAGDLAGDDLLRLVGLGVCVRDDGDVAEEVRFEGGVEDKVHALDGEVCGDFELRERGRGWVREGVGGGDDGVEGLGLAAGGDGGAADDGGVGMREGFAVRGAEMKEDVEVRARGFLEGE